ncbi:MAG: DUF58 domain-containing protein, partial [Fimbriiglobus sp.]
MRVLVGILAVLGLAFALQAGLVAFAGYVVLGVALLSRHLAREWVAALAAERVCDTAPKEIGDSVEVVVRVRNTGTLPVGWVLVEDMAVEKAEARNRLVLKGSRVRVFFLKVGHAKTVKYRLTFAARGYFPVGPCVAETGDVFGLHRRHRVLTPPAYVLVYPKVL